MIGGFRESAALRDDILAIHVRKSKIEQDDVWRTSSDGAQSGFSVRCRQNLKAADRQRRTQVAQDFRLVIDSKDARTAHPAAARAGDTAAGKRSTMRVPRLRIAGLCATMVPSIASTRPRQIERPRPVPALRPSGRPPR